MARASDPRFRAERGGEGIGLGPVFVVGLVLLIVGALMVVHAVSAPASPPPGAEKVPGTVTTAVPTPMAAPTAAPLGASVPVTIQIPALSVSAPVMRLGRNSDGTVQVPPLGNHNLAGWYTGSVTPGQDGSAIILGHVDTYTGPSVFYAIKNLRRDQQIDIVRADGTTAVFAVDGVRRVAKATFPASSMYGNVGYPALRLITCGGPFDDKTGEYLDNIVVYAHLTATYVAA
jgi:sortase (surface protein transpeptidase)